MKNLKKCMLLVMLAIFTMGMAIPVQAKTETKFLTLYPTKDAKVRSAGKNSVQINVQNGKITDLQSSNKAVASVKAEKSKYSPGYTSITANLKKPGKTTISYKYKEKGKTKIYKTTVIVKKYVNPVASVKINNMKIKGTSFKNTSVYKVKYSKFANKKTKITITPAKGWHLSGKVSSYEKRSVYYKKAEEAYKREDYDALEKIDAKISKLPEKPGMEIAGKKWMKSDHMQNGETIKMNIGKGFEVFPELVNTKTKQVVKVVILFE